MAGRFTDTGNAESGDRMTKQPTKPPITTDEFISFARWHSWMTQHAAHAAEFGKLSLEHKRMLYTTMQAWARFVASRPVGKRSRKAKASA